MHYSEVRFWRQFRSIDEIKWHRYQQLDVVLNRETMIAYYKLTLEIDSRSVDPDLW